MKLEKGKAICEAYKNGNTISQIAKKFNNKYDLIKGYLKRYFEYFYNEPFISYGERKKERLEELYNEYVKIYVQGLYTRQQLCKILKCDVNELEAMFRKYNLHNQCLKTYHNQVTLCSTSKEFRKSVSDFAKKYGYKSVRAVCMQAINEFMLQEILRRENESQNN